VVLLGTVLVAQITVAAAVAAALLVALNPNVRCASSLDIPQTTVGIVLMRIMSLNQGVLLLHLGRALIMPGIRIRGATDHITGELDRLTLHEPYTSPDQIHAANGSGMDITRIVSSIIPSSGRDLVLNNVLHVPST
jgi:hypothetical protein